MGLLHDCKIVWIEKICQNEERRRTLNCLKRVHVRSLIFTILALPTCQISTVRLMKYKELKSKYLLKGI